MAHNQTYTYTLKLGGVLGMAAFLVAAPISVHMENGFSLPSVTLSAAFAKSGNSGSGSSGSGGGGSGNSGSGSSGGSDDGGHHSGDDDSGHHSGTDDSGHHGGTATGGTSGGLAVVKVESSGSGIEVTYSDGSREEIENGRYEAKNSAGRTVTERAATQADIDRLRALF
jgi:hypothetical protein